MDVYLKKTKQKKIVYSFEVGDGGIGDLIKFFMYTLMFCMENDIQLYYVRNNIPIEKYIQLKYPSMYISHDQIKNNTYYVDSLSILTIFDGPYNIVRPQIIYSRFSYDKIKIPVQDVFCFSEDVLKNSQHLLSPLQPYTSIHMRLGDKHLETDKRFVQCKNDERHYNEAALHKFIESNRDTPVLFFCDNNTYKETIVTKYPHIQTLNTSIGHTGLINTTDKQVLDAVTEFYVLSNSQKIVIASESGFSRVASLFKRVPIVSL